jgi:hypothetical protein
MARPSLEELQRVWLLAYSRASFLEAAEFLKAMDAANPESVTFRALVHAAFVAYARPFNQCKVPGRRRLVPLKDVPPPPLLADFHRHALDARNTTIGHKDATPARGYTATPNVMLFEIKSSNFGINTAMPSEMKDPMKKAMRELCDHFVKHCEQELGRWKRAYGSEVMKKPPGDYELVICEPPFDWMIPARTKHGADFRA